MNKAINLLLITFLGLAISCNKDRGEMIDSEWIAQSIQYENGDKAYPDAKGEYVLSFENKSQFRIQLDINLCGGEAKFRSSSVKFEGGMACTEACCDSDFAVSLVDHLPKTDKWKLNGNSLIFSNNKGLEIVFIKK